jgi:hypothetical protein
MLNSSFKRHLIFKMKLAFFIALQKFRLACLEFLWLRYIDPMLYLCDASVVSLILGDANGIKAVIIFRYEFLATKGSKLNLP